MVNLTIKESEVLLMLFKDFSKNYNANSLSKKINITARGTLKILKKLKEHQLVISKAFGKATFYKVNLEDNYTFKIIETLLMGETKEKAPRWLVDFKEINNQLEVSVIFGSMIRNSKNANDIDLMMILQEKNLKEVRKLIDEKNKILVKPIHPLFQSINDLKKNLKKRDPVILNALREGFVLKGENQLIEVIKGVTSF